MEQKSQVNHTNVSGDLALANPKELGFQIPLMDCCKETILLLENALHFYGQH